MDLFSEKDIQAIRDAHDAIASLRQLFPLPAVDPHNGYYSDSAIRERCAAAIFDFRKAHVNAIFNTQITQEAEYLFEYIKNGPNREKQ